MQIAQIHPLFDAVQHHNNKILAIRGHTSSLATLPSTVKRSLIAAHMPGNWGAASGQARQKSGWSC